MITFTKVKLPYGWLSNMSPHKIEVQRGMNSFVVYFTAEHLFQCLRFDDFAIRDQIMAPKSPMAAKMVAKKYLDKAVVTPRSEQDLFNMKFVLMLKIRAYPDLAKALLETGDEEIVEDVTRRPNESGLYWGKALIDGQWQGHNQLGKLWMEVRDQLRQKMSAIQ